jgi:hypothetical protein
MTGRAPTRLASSMAVLPLCTGKQGKTIVQYYAKQETSWEERLGNGDEPRAVLPL